MLDFEQNPKCLSLDQLVRDTRTTYRLNKFKNLCSLLYDLYRIVKYSKIFVFSEGRMPG